MADNRSLPRKTWQDLRLVLEEQCRLQSQEAIADRWVYGYPLASLYAYRGPMRQVILDFKVKGSWQSGMALVEIFCADAGVLAWAQGCAAIMPVPSSFWGRWHGKHDLAFALAEGLAQRLNLPLVRAPKIKYFRFKKQSFLSRTERMLASISTVSGLSREDALELSESHVAPRKEHGKSCSQILLIDDIVTSAKTLTALAQAFRNKSFRFLTLASAYHKTDGTIRSFGEII